MKAVLLFGSPRENGYTKIMTDEYLSLTCSDMDIQIFNAYRLNAKPCVSCGFCASNSACVYHDLDDLFSAVSECDLLIIASPVYFLSFPAPLKAIIDRLQRFHEASKNENNSAAPKPRTLCALLTAGSPSEKGEVISKQLKWISRALGINDYSIFVHSNTDKLNHDEFRISVREIISENIP